MMCVSGGFQIAIIEDKVKRQRQAIEYLLNLCTLTPEDKVFLDKLLDDKAHAARYIYDPY